MNKHIYMYRNANDPNADKIMMEKVRAIFPIPTCSSMRNNPLQVRSLKNEEGLKDVEVIFGYIELE